MTRSSVILSACISASVLTLGACSSTGVQNALSPIVNALPSEQDLSDQSQALDSAALNDLISALVQYRDPINTTLQAGLDMASDDMASVLTAIAEQGYGLQLVDADQGANLIDYSITGIEPTPAQTKRYQLTVGRLELARTYAVLNNRVRPISPLSVAGSRRVIELNDAQYGDDIANDALISRVTYTSAPDVTPEETPRISLLQLPLDAPTDTPSLSTNASGLEITNVFDGANNFGSLLDSYTKVETTRIIFPNDSMRLGNIGRLKIDVFLGEFEEDEDLIRVIGCSNGKTNLAIGNEGLALGRAERVTQELLARGVTRESILDEGCWAPTSAGDRFPSRGVVLELYRAS